MTRSERDFATTIPAREGFWLHLMDDETGEPIGLKLAVIGWLIDARARAYDWVGITEPLTTDGLITQEYFIEQPDGSCVHPMFHADNRDEMLAKLKAEREERKS